MWLWLEVCFQLLQRLPGYAELSNPLLPFPAPHLLARAQPTPQEWFWAGAEGGKGEKNSVVTEQFQSSSSSLASCTGAQCYPCNFLSHWFQACSGQCPGLVSRLHLMLLYHQWEKLKSSAPVLGQQAAPSGDSSHGCSVA